MRTVSCGLLLTGVVAFAQQSAEGSRLVRAIVYALRDCVQVRNQPFETQEMASLNRNIRGEQGTFFGTKGFVLLLSRRHDLA